MKDRDYWKERLPLIQAYVDGHDIRFKKTTTRQDPDIYFAGKPNEYTILPKPDPFKELKEAYARGERVQYFYKLTNRWDDLTVPMWLDDVDYRIKPKEDPYKKFKDAIKEGRVIQQYRIFTNTWYDRPDPKFYDIPEFYRIKPEPKLVPFTIDDVDSFRGKWAKSKVTNAEYLLTSITEYEVALDGRLVSYETLLQNYKFTDGSPCGKYVECE